MVKIKTATCNSFYKEFSKCKKYVLTYHMALMSNQVSPSLCSLLANDIYRQAGTTVNASS